MNESAGGRIVTLDTEGAPHACMRARLNKQIDAAVNAGAILEAAEATSDLVSPDELHDTAESPYLTDEVSFKELEVGCGHCFSLVSVNRSGDVTANMCMESGICEWQIAARLSRESYELPARSVPERPVSCAGVDCTARVALRSTVLGAPLAPQIVSGQCTVDRRAGEWRSLMALAIRNQAVEGPDSENVESFDGVDISDYPDEV